MKNPHTLKVCMEQTQFRYFEPFWRGSRWQRARLTTRARNVVLSCSVLSRKKLARNCTQSCCGITRKCPWLSSITVCRLTETAECIAVLQVQTWSFSFYGPPSSCRLRFCTGGDNSMSVTLSDGSWKAISLEMISSTVWYGVSTI